MNAHALNAGFSLVEVMVAILILGIALVAMTRGITTALESSKDSELQTTAALLAAGKIETLRAAGGLQEGESDGDGGPGLESYLWTRTVTGTDIHGLYDVDVVVESARDNRQIYELKTMLFEPPGVADQGNSQEKQKGPQ